MHSPRYQHDDVRLPTLRDVLTPLFRYHRAVIVVFVLTASAVVTAAMLARDTYEARMKILVKRERLDPIVTSDPQAPSSARVEIAENELYSEVELIRSRDLLEQVVRASGLLGPEGSEAAKAAAADPKRVARAVGGLRGRLRVEPVRKT